jgi:ligand-binding sensor domain-containing protein/serine phosphatase RsbU (regulator of sigma subunit)
VKFICLYILIAISFFSCKEKDNQNIRLHAIKVTKAKGYVVPKDSMVAPVVVLVNESKLLKVGIGKTNIFLTNTNVHPFVNPTAIVPGGPSILMPGKDTLILPKVIPIKENELVKKRVGVPEEIIAKDPITKDQNPSNFSTYGKLQGLKHGTINCLLEDNKGNIWLGTQGAGVSKYDGKTFTHYTTLEGLCSNAINSIFEDKAGNLWFASSDAGVCKYDGKFFTHYSDKDGLSKNYITCIFQDQNENMWFGTADGLAKFDGKSFTNYYTTSGLVNNVVYSICEDDSHNIWLSTGAGISMFNGKVFSNYTTTQGISDNTIQCSLKDRKGKLWFGTYQGGLTVFEEKNIKHFGVKEGLSNPSVSCILEDKTGNIWIGTTGGGLNKFDGKTFINYTEQEGLNSNDILSLLEDKSGNIWIGSATGGLSKYDGKTFTHFTEKEGLSNSLVFPVLEDKSGNIWLGTSGNGINIYDGKSFSHLTDKVGINNNDVKSIIQDRQGNIWFGTYNEGVNKFDGNQFTHYSEKDGLANNIVYAILEDKKGNIWFGTDGGGASKFDGKSFSNYTIKQGLVDNFINAILEDSNGNIWFATNGGGVSKFDGKSFVNFSVNDGLGNNIVKNILEDRKGHLWFATNEGVSMYDGFEFKNFTEKDGLSHNVVFSMVQDKIGNIWFGTRFGLSKLTEKKCNEVLRKIKSNSLTENDVIFKNYTYQDGFLGVGVNGGKTMQETRDGSIWISANDRLMVYHPPIGGEKSDTNAPCIQLGNIELFNQNISWAAIENKTDTSFLLGNGVKVGNFQFTGISNWNNLPENLSLAYNNNYITFNFIGVTMNQPKKVKYQYILEGLEENWSAVTPKNSAPYGNLPHGSYIFKVKAMNSEGYWSQPIEFAFIIRPPFWQTWWFRVLVLLGILSSIWYFIKSREKKLIAEKLKLEKTVEERTAEVVEQKHMIEEKHKEITDSINYAERIQRSLLATKELLDENLSDYFILFKPKDVVSGDFYRAAKLSNGNFALLTADSTGHGVPGAIMSILNISCLKESVKEGILQPAEILNRTRQLIIDTLALDGSAEGGKDGMDASLTIYDFKNKKLSISSANNPVWIVRSTNDSLTKEVIEIKADKMPVGKHDRQNISFTQHEIELQSNDVVYTLTDGFPDQFGGPNGKKFMSKKLRELLAANAHLSMIEQKQLLETLFIEWKGNNEQVDDVCLIGVRV